MPENVRVAVQRNRRVRRVDAAVDLHVATKGEILPDRARAVDDEILRFVADVDVVVAIHRDVAVRVDRHRLPRHHAHVRVAAHRKGRPTLVILEDQDVRAVDRQGLVDPEVTAVARAEAILTDPLNARSPARGRLMVVVHEPVTLFIVAGVGTATVGNVQEKS